MRLSHQQIQSITDTIRQLVDAQATVYLFGSRLNQQAKGGDVDLQKPRCRADSISGYCIIKGGSVMNHSS